MELNGKKVLVVCTTDNMIWQFLLPSIFLMREMGAEVHCACNETGFWFEELQTKNNLVLYKMPFERSPFKPSNLKAYKSLKGLVREQNYDLIYCHQPVGGVMGRLVAKKFNIPVIYVAHGFHFYKGCPKKNILFKWIEKYCAKHTSALVTMNEEDYQASLKMKAKKKYKINGIGLDFNKYINPNVGREEMRQSMGIDTEFVIVTVAEMIKRKNYNTMLKTIEGLKNENIKFLICGRGEQEEIIRQQIVDLKIEDKVMVLGYRKDINNILNASDIFFLPSFQEGLTLSVIEAMNFGLPCAVSNVRGNQDLIQHNKGGIVLNPKDVDGFVKALKYLISNPEVSREMGVYNKQQSYQYNNEKVLEQIKTIIKEV